MYKTNRPNGEIEFDSEPMKGACVPEQFQYESTLVQAGRTFVAGVDEAGRGPLAGPVVAAAVMFPVNWIRSGLPKGLEGLTDSKQLSEEEREDFFVQLTSHPKIHFSIAEVDAETIDDINILKATHRAMGQALARLRPSPQYVLVDGYPVRSLPFPQEAIVKGDSQSYSIAAASVLAKVTRDRLMLAYDRQYPSYGFAGHKGYGTPKHRAALAELGPCPIHRRSFSLIKWRQSDLF